MYRPKQIVLSACARTDEDQRTAKAFKQAADQEKASVSQVLWQLIKAYLNDQSDLNR